MLGFRVLGLRFKFQVLAETYSDLPCFMGLVGLMDFVWFKAVWISVGFKDLWISVGL